jgi:phospholipid-binding lipoprotein MlaA
LQQIVTAGNWLFAGGYDTQARVTLAGAVLAPTKILDHSMPSFPGSKLASLLGLVLTLTMLSACATPPPADDPDAVTEFRQLNDPLEPMNRDIFAANLWLDDNALVPAAKAYRAVTPRFGRERIADVLSNLKSPLIFANDLLEGNLSRAGVTLGRFLLNSTFGVAGLMDVATPMGLVAHNADLGQTLAVWGVPDGPYLVLPLFGPSNPRDGFGLGAESFLDPLSYYLASNHMRWVSTGKFLLGGLSAREAYLETIDDIKRSSLDYYSALRSLRRQNRDAQIDQARKGVWAPDEFRNPK